MLPARSSCLLLNSLNAPCSQWEESFEGGSTLYGGGSDTLVRRTAYPPRSSAPDRTADGTDSLGPPLDAASVAHVTWSSRVDDRAEITSRYLRGNAMVVERLLLKFGQTLTTVRSEETFAPADLAAYRKACPAPPRTRSARPA